MRILGIDPGLATMGWGVIEAEGPRHKLVDCGALITPPDKPQDGLYIYGETPAFSKNEKRCVLGVEYRNGRAIRVVTLDLLDWESVIPVLRKEE